VPEVAVYRGEESLAVASALARGGGLAEDFDMAARRHPHPRAAEDTLEIGRGDPLVRRSSGAGLRWRELHFVNLHNAGAPV